ncbi:MAG: glycerophosphodiester phosphodiesterase [Oscillospiraceae bacterium]|nr:glycerophosphodiester phosphodiesterase [Oscillospiraceae bacterium]
MYRNFAHRGLHKRDKTVPENSIAAFERAASKGYGIELDVQLSKDGQVVVFHDDTLNRVCGVDSRVDEKTYEELSRLSLCGTGETIPLFSEVLRTVRGRGPLIVELKNGRSNRELCEKTYELLKGYSGIYCIESFNPLIVRWFRKNAPEVLRGQLACPKEDYGEEVKPATAFVLSRLLLNFLARPQFVAYKIAPKPFTARLCEAMGAMKVCWTSHEWINEKKSDAVIFEFYNPKLKYNRK